MNQSLMNYHYDTRQNTETICNTLIDIFYYGISVTVENKCTEIWNPIKLPPLPHSQDNLYPDNLSTHWCHSIRVLPFIYIK